MKHSTILPQTSSTMADPNTNPSADKRKGHGPTVNALKRAKFEAKQERRRQQELQIHQHPQYASWFNGREEYAAFVTADDVHAIRKLRGGTDLHAASISARLKRIAEWIEPFFDLKEMPSNNNNTRDGEERLFISEGTEAVRMMIQRCSKNAPTQPSDVDTIISAAYISHDKGSTEATASTSSPPPVRLVSILSKPATFFDAPTQLLKDIEKRNFTNPVSQEEKNIDNDKVQVIPPFKIIIANEEALSEIAGFPIARGALACGIVPSYMQNHAYEWLKNLLSSETSSYTATQSTTQQQVQQNKPITRRRKLLALDRIANAANMGSILRTAAAFSIDAIILSDDSCDAWYRQSVRVSLGHVVTVPIIRVSDWKRGYEKDLVNNNKNNETSSSNNDANNGGLGRVLDWLRDEMNVESLAAVVDDESDKGFPPLVTLESYQLCNDHSWICVLGTCIFVLLLFNLVHTPC